MTIKNIDENWIHEVKSLKEEIKKDYKNFLKFMENSLK